MVAVVIEEQSESDAGKRSALGQLFNAFTSDCNVDFNTNLISDDDETVTKQKRLTNEDRATIVGCLEIAIRKHGAIPRKEKFYLAERFQVTERSVSAVWKRYEETGCHKTLRHNCGRKPKWNKTHLDKMLEIPLEFKETLRSLAEALSIPRSSLHSLLRKSAIDGTVRRTSSYLKPMLDDFHKLRRAQFVREHIDMETGMFDDMMDKVHIDEKWFYIDKRQRSFYLHKDEPDPHRRCKNKSYLTKVMFMAAVARPRFLTAENKWFNGLIGIFPFVEQVEAV